MIRPCRIDTIGSSAFVMARDSGSLRAPATISVNNDIYRTIVYVRGLDTKTVSVEVTSIVILVLIFVIATWRDVNMGVLGIVAAFIFGTFVLHLDTNDVWKGFPVDLFVTLVGLTYLFGFAQGNGAIEVLVRWSMRLVRGNVALAPWIFFAITAALVGIGALFSVAIVTPLALGFARRNRVNQFMMGLLVVHGALAGAFSPISVYGVIINGFMAKQRLATSPFSLFAAPLVFSLVFAIVVYLVLRKHPDADMRAGTGGTAEAAERVEPLTGYQVTTIVALAIMVVLVVGFNLNIGVVSMTLAAVLAVLQPREGVAALGRVSWPAVVLITGVLTYIAVLQRAGTVEWVSRGISAVPIPLVAALLLFYLSGFVSSLASSAGPGSLPWFSRSRCRSCSRETSTSPGSWPRSGSRPRSSTSARSRPTVPCCWPT
jgi:hypothetical protein